MSSFSSVHRYHHHPAASCVSAGAPRPGLRHLEYPASAAATALSAFRVNSPKSPSLLSLSDGSISSPPSSSSYVSTSKLRLRMFFFNFLPFSYEPDHGINTSIHIMHAKRAADRTRTLAESMFNLLRHTKSGCYSQRISVVSKTHIFLLTFSHDISLWIAIGKKKMGYLQKVWNFLCKHTNFDQIIHDASMISL